MRPEIWKQWQEKVGEATRGTDMAKRPSGQDLAAQEVMSATENGEFMELECLCTAKETAKPVDS